MKASAEARERPKPKASAKPKRESNPPTGASITPVVILIAPQLGENIGFSARAMANFGLSGFAWSRHATAGRTKRRAPQLLAPTASSIGRRSMQTLRLAVADLNFLLATTARPRGMVKPVLTLEGAARELAARGAKGERTAVLFGPERNGLDNESISLADAIVTAPVNPSFASLSLPQTVLLVAYEWLQAQGSALPLDRATDAMDRPPKDSILPARARPIAPSSLRCSSTWKTSSTALVSCARRRSAPPWCAPSVTCFIAWG